MKKLKVRETFQLYVVSHRNPPTYHLSSAAPKPSRAPDILRHGFWTILAVLAISAARCGAGEITPGDHTVGTQWMGEVGVRQTTGEIERRDSLQADPQKTKHLFPIGRTPMLEVGQDLRGAQALSSLGIASGSTLHPFVSQTLGINFTGATFFDCAGWPPDTMGTVGPTQFIVALNGRIRSFNKATGAADGGINTTTDSFFSAVMTPGSNYSTDPRIRYDRLSGRWFITMIDVPGRTGNQPNRVMIAMSNSGTITGSTVWTFFQFSGDATNFADYPTLGIDSNALYIGANIFSTGNGSFVNTTAFVVRKSSLVSGGPIVMTAFSTLIRNSGHPPRTSGPFAPQGVDNYDPAANEGYFIGVDINSTSTLQLRRVSDPGGTPSLSGNVSIGVSSFAAPIDVTVQGTSGTMDALGSPARLLEAHYRNGSLWTSHNVGVNSSGGTSNPDRTGSRWYQINGIPTGQAPGVTQSGTVFQSGSANRSYWMGTIMVSGQGHAAMGFTTAGPNNFLDAATTGRLVGDAPGTMTTPVTYTASSSAYNPSDGTAPHRWGDYSYTSLDPSDDMTMWTIQEWCQSSGNGYAVQVARLLAPPPAQPINCTPASLTRNTANLTVVINGSPANGAGFFEPGTNFPNHITVAVNGGGVAVNSVTYSNPTNIAVNLTVAPGSALGARTITVTNPDGQLASSATGILTIDGGANNPPTLTAISNKTTAVGMTLTLTNAASDSDNPPQTLTFSLGSGAVTNASLDATTGVFAWSPTQEEIGSNSFSIIVTDNGLPPMSATQSFVVTVVASNNPPLLAPIADLTNYASITVVLTNSAIDPDPLDILSFSLEPGASAGASIGITDGVFSWTPSDSQTGSNSFTVRVTDSGVPNLSDAKTFSVTVLPRPLLESISLTNNVVALTWSALAGTTYRVQFKTNLADTAWTDLVPDIEATGPIATATDVSSTNVFGFYRVFVVP